MDTQALQAIILAAGKSQRFNTDRTKLLEKICGQEMILYATKLFSFLHIDTTLVVGHQKESIIATLTKHHGSSLRFATQEKQLGTGHALLCSQGFWEKEHILVMNGDMPLVSPEIIEQLWQKHQESQAVMSFITAHHPEPSGYGRVIHENRKIKIVEAKDFTGDYTQQCCINAGIYIISRSFLQTYISLLTDKNNAQEFYLTDLVHMASTNNLTVTTVAAPFDTIRGINTFKELWIVEHIKQSEIIEYWMSKGVRFSGAQTVRLDVNVTVGPGSHIEQSSQLLGTTAIGKNCHIKPFCILENATIKNNVTIEPYSLIKNSHLNEGAHVGPFIYLSENSYISTEPRAHSSARQSSEHTEAETPIKLRHNSDIFLNTL